MNYFLFAKYLIPMYLNLKTAAVYLEHISSRFSRNSYTLVFQVNLKKMLFGKYSN